MSKSKKKIAFYFLLAVLLNSISSCKDSEDNVNNINSSPYYEVVNNLSILKEDGLSFIKDSIKSDSLVVFAGNTPNSIIPQVGSNIYIPVSQKSPYGMLAKVMSVNKGSDISVVTQALPLEDAFEYLSVDTTLSVITELDGVFDKEGKPLDYEIVDTAEMNTDINVQSQHFNNSSIKSRASFKYDWDWKKECLKFPIKLYKGNSGKDKITINGMVYVGFDKFDLDIDVNKFKVNYIKLDATPYVKLAAESVVSTESKVELEDRIGQLRFKVTVPTPIGVPVIVPITLYMYGTCGIKGELSAKLGLQYKYNCNCVATYKNGQWTSKATHGGFNNKSPWIVSEFDVKGEIYSGARIGLLAGLYSATTGIGFNFTPKFSIGAEAKLSSPNLLKANPEVGLNLLVGSDVYCVAEIFGKKLGKYSLKFPDYTLWSTKMYLLPNIENFTATGASSSADISWSHNSLYFLEPIGIETGTTIFGSDKTTELKSYTPSPTNKNNMGYCTYNVTATGLNSGSTYYAAPFASWKDFKWFGDKEKITTEAGYTVYWRCQGREDIWSKHIDINSTNTNIDMTFDAPTYTGQTKRYLKASYNPMTQSISGTVETLFYDNHNDRRIDGFSLDLSAYDTGYITNSKVLDNGACYTQIRFVKDGHTVNAKNRSKKIKDDSIGLEPCGYGERIIK